MKDEDIHVGDVLRIRSFEDMKSEFGVGQDGYIHGGYGAWFGDEMEALCGNVFTVSELNDGGYGSIEYRSVEGVENCDDGAHWGICAWMLEPYEEDTEWEVADDNQVALLLS